MTNETTSAAPRSMVLVAGAGRSGTSTVAGALHHLGVTVPKPWVPADDSNPRGFFETRWVVWRNMEILKNAHLSSLDTAPGAPEHAEQATTPEIVARMREGIANLPDDKAIVLKDPRTVWTAPTWIELAQEAGYEVSFLTMLRHPAEVLGSRKAHYKDGGDGFRRSGVQASQLAGWLNVNLATERQSRGHKRSFVLYEELLASWRGPMRQVSEQLGLTYNADLTVDELHKVDEFIEPRLRRNRGSWDELQAPGWLVDLARTTYETLRGASLGEVPDDEVARRLDEVWAEYRKQYDYATAIVGDRARRRVKTAESRAATTARREAFRETSVTRLPARKLLRELRRRAARRVRTSS